LHQSRQFRPGFHPHPKYPRRTLVRIPAQTAQRKFEWLTRAHLRERIMEFLQPRFRPFADELRRNVQIVERAPLDRRLGTQRAQQTFQPKARFGRQVDGREQSHATVLAYPLALVAVSSIACY